MVDLRPLRSASFRHLAGAYWVNEFGTWIGEIALTFLVYDRTHSPLGTAVLFLAMRFVPALLAPLLTTRIETIRLRRLLPVLYVLEASFFAVLALVARRHVSVDVVLVLAAADGVLAIAAKALTRTATANGLLKFGLLREGNAILNLGLMVATACSPILASVLVAWKGVPSALLLDAATFLLTAALVATASEAQVASDYEAGMMGRMRAGLEVARRRGAVRRLLSALALVMLLSSVPIPIEIVFVKRTLHAHDAAYGILLGSWGLGMMLGAAAFAVATTRRLTGVFAVGMVIMAVGYGELATAPTLAVACIGSAIGGVGNGLGWVAAVTALQERLVPTVQSTVMTLLEGLNQVMPALGFAIGGAVTAISSPRVAYGLAAIGVAVVMLAFTLRPVDQIRFERSSPGVPPRPSTERQYRAETEQAEPAETDRVGSEPARPESKENCPSKQDVIAPTRSSHVPHIQMAVPIG